MFKKIEYFIFKRLFPVLIILLGMFIFYKIDYLGNLGEIISIKMLGFVVSVFGFFLISNEINLKGIYWILMSIFLVIFMVMFIHTLKNIGNAKWLHSLYFFLAYCVSGAIWFIFRIAAEKDETTSQ